jgi:hypothetical protein
VHVAGSLTSLGHEVVQLQENAVDFDRLQPRFDLLLWTRTWEVERDAAERMLVRFRDAGVPSVSFHLDRFHGLDREYLIAQEPFFRTDVLFSPDDGPWEKYGVHHVWMPPGVYHAECVVKPARPGRWPFDVVFVGSHPYPHKEWEPVRTRLIDTFKRAFGKRFAILPAPNRPLRGAGLQSLYSTVPVVLGDSCLVGDPYRYWSDRIPETLGRGAALIHPDVDGMADWYDDSYHLVNYCVKYPDDAVDCAYRLLAEPDLRARIATQGRETVLGRDTYRHRMRTVLEYVGAMV